MSGPFIGDPSFAQTTEQKVEWLIKAVMGLKRWAEDTDLAILADAFTTTGLITSSHSLDAAAGTSTDVRNVLATLLNDMRKRGSKGI